MGVLKNFREQAGELKGDLELHGRTIADAVRSNTYVVALVALVSCIALALGVTALRRATR
jgi:hypothetical protein